MVKKIAATLLSLSVLLAGCASAEPITGEPETLLVDLLSAADQKLPAGGQTPDAENVEITAETAQNAIGLTPDQFNQTVASAWQARSLLSVSAETTVLIKAKDASAANEVAKLIASGFDSGQWICVAPERSEVAAAGSFVLLAVGTQEKTQAVFEAFNELAGGKASEPNVFFTSDRQGGDTDIEIAP
ncbi:MAG: DUF4358 domain-containing protein [Propionibacteriaceae bacterium]|nr:DUF4358 domain-containing protein [Propionibacteriaceae bacterium]